MVSAAPLARGDCSDVACGRKWEMGNSLLGQSCKLNENE